MKGKKQDAMRENNEVGWVGDKCQLWREWGSGSLSEEPSRSCQSERTFQTVRTSGSEILGGRFGNEEQKGWGRG